MFDYIFVLDSISFSLRDYLLGFTWLSYLSLFLLLSFHLLELFKLRVKQFYHPQKAQKDFLLYFVGVLIFICSTNPILNQFSAQKNWFYILQNILIFLICAPLLTYSTRQFALLNKLRGFRPLYLLAFYALLLALWFVPIKHNSLNLRLLRETFFFVLSFIFWSSLRRQKVFYKKSPKNYFFPGMALVHTLIIISLFYIEVSYTA